MIKTIKVMLLAVFFSFLWGVWWALKDDIKPVLFNEKVSLTLLAPEGLFDNQFIEALAENNFIVDLQTKKTSYDLLLEVLSPEKTYDLIVFPSFLANSIPYSNYFKPNFDENYYDELDISIDFRSLQFDPESKYSVPFLWRLFVWQGPGESQELSLKALSGSGRSKFYSQAEPALLYSLLNKFFPQAHSLIQINNKESLAPLFKKFKQALVLKKSATVDLSKDYQQVPHTLAKDILLPAEKADLELLFFAQSTNSKADFQVKRFIKFIFKNKLNGLLEDSNYASVSHFANDLPDAKLPQFIRSLPISKIGIESYHEAYEPLFTEFLRDNYPMALGEK